MEAALERKLAERVHKAARDGSLIETAQVKLLGLDEIRLAAGARWPRMRERVREGSMKLIAARVGEDDAVVACGDGFLVVFAEGSPEQTRSRCAEIQDALRAFYLGEQGLTALRADVQREAANAASIQTIAVAEIRARPEAFAIGQYWPVWSRRRQGIAALLCSPVIDAHGGLSRIGYKAEFVSSGRHFVRDFGDLDLCLLEQACAAAEADAALPIAVTVHATTMQARKSRARYLEHVRAVFETSQRLSFVTIAEIEPGTPLLSLTEWCASLKDAFVRVALNFHHSDRALGAISATGAWAAGYHLPMWHAETEPQVRSALNQLEYWCAALNRQHLVPFLHGFTSEAFFNLAGYSEFGLATGTLWPSGALQQCGSSLEANAPIR